MISTESVDNPNICNVLLPSKEGMLNQAITLLLVDGLNLIRRIHAAQQGVEKLHSTVLQSIHRAVRETSASHLLFVMDGEGPTWRHKLYPEYKQGRRPMPEDLQQFLPVLLHELQQAGVQQVSREGVEADDLIAAVVTRLSGYDLCQVILSTDKGFLPLLSDQVCVRDHFKQHNVSVEDVRERFGLPTNLLRDLWALAGDNSNHIPGVTGIGLKTAVRLLSHYGSLNNILAEADHIDGSVGGHLREQKEQALLYRKLLEPQVALALELNLRECRLAGGWV